MGPRKLTTSDGYFVGTRREVKRVGERVGDAVAKRAAWALPHRVVMWAAVRLGAHATTGEYGATIVPELTFMDALGRWS